MAQICGNEQSLPMAHVWILAVCRKPNNYSFCLLDVYSLGLLANRDFLLRQANSSSAACDKGFEALDCSTVSSHAPTGSGFSLYVSVLSLLPSQHSQALGSVLCYM